MQRTLYLVAVSICYNKINERWTRPMPSNASFSPWIQYDLQQWGSLSDEKYLIRIKEKTIIYNQEEAISNIYIVKQGRVRLSYYSTEGVEKIYLFALTGCMFGEETCFEPEAEFLRAETIVDSEFYCIPKDEFLNLLSRDISLNAQVLSSMSHKIHVLMEHIRRLSFLNAKSRIAAVFVDLANIFGVMTADGFHIELPVIQQGIGNLVNASRLTVNQVIGEFEALGILDKKGGVGSSMIWIHSKHSAS